MEKTTLILGAGFSIPYGYPSGKDLVYHLKNWPVYGDHKIDLLKKIISDNGSESIDALLNDHPDHFNLGIHLIAEKLLDTEIQYIQRHQTEEQARKFSEIDIITFLINNLKEEDFEKYNIITFNYDRHLEWKLFKRLKLKYKSNKLAMLALGKLKIVHVHGSMAPFTDHDLLGNPLGRMTWVPYGTDAQEELSHNQWNETVYREIYTKYAKSNIKTVYTNKEIKTEIKDMIQEATRVFFLGFAYDETNLKLLGITPENASLRNPYNWRDKIVAGTALGLSTIEKNKITRLFPFLGGFNLKSTDCKTFFQEEFSLTNCADDKQSNMKQTKITCCQINAFQEFESYHVNYAAGQRVDQKFVCKTCNITQVAYFDRTPLNWNLATLRKD